MYGKTNRRPGKGRGMLRAAALILSGLALGSCLDQFELTPPEPISCSSRRLNLAASLYEQSKEFMTDHFKERDDLSLLYAYYASMDAEDLTRSIRSCDDFNDVAKARGTDLIRAARMLRKAVLLNMRDPDPALMVQLLGRKYVEVFKSDIH